MLVTRRAHGFAVAFAVGSSMPAIASACWMHQVIDLSVPSVIGALPTATTKAHRGSGDSTPSLAPVTAWKQNFSGAHGTSTDSTINGYVSQTLADAQQVSWDSNYAYVKITDVPSHPVGPFPGNPAYPAAQNKTIRITRTPTEATTKSLTGNGPIGVMVNGCYFFNATDAMSYNGAGVWQQNANVVEASSFDVARGHPAPQMGGGGSGLRAGIYHYHQSPSSLLGQLDPNNTGQHHSPLLGYAFDGFPIYGPYGYVDPTNPNSGVKALTSGYKIRDDVAAGNRNTLVDGGATLPTSQRGPAVSATYPAGYYLQDYEWDSSAGDLNANNMRFAVTPEYPEGTWAYFTGATNSGGIAYPYLLGPSYFGVVDAGAANATIPTGATQLKAGDANADGAVNFADLLILSQHYGQTGATDWQTGDFDRNASIDFSDLLLLSQNYAGGSSLAMSEFARLQSLTPEPTTLLGVGAMATLLLRGKR